MKKLTIVIVFAVAAMAVRAALTRIYFEKNRCSDGSFRLLE